MVAGELLWISDQVKSVPLEFIQASTFMHAVYYYMPKVCIQGPKNTGTFWSFFWAKMFFAQRLLTLPNSNPFVNILFLFQKKNKFPTLSHFKAFLARAWSQFCLPVTHLMVLHKNCHQLSQNLSGRLATLATLQNWKRKHCYLKPSWVRSHNGPHEGLCVGYLYYLEAI
jgi:hypothetical protein